MVNGNNVDCRLKLKILKNNTHLVQQFRKSGLSIQFNDRGF